MLVNTLTLSTNEQVHLLEEVFDQPRLNQLHALCKQFSPGCEHWPMPDWTEGRPRYMFDRQGAVWAELDEYFNSAEFKKPLEDQLGISLQRSESSIWADLTGFGPLGAHKEGGGSYMIQVYLTDTPHDYSGTTIYNEAGEVLVQLPYRDNFAWFFHGMKIMHGRHHDVPAGIKRFTLQIWYCESVKT